MYPKKGYFFQFIIKNGVIYIYGCWVIIFTWIWVMTLFNGTYSGHQNGSICHSSREVQLTQQIQIEFNSMDQNQNGTKISICWIECFSVVQSYRTSTGGRFLLLWLIVIVENLFSLVSHFISLHSIEQMRWLSNSNKTSTITV